MTRRSLTKRERAAMARRQGGLCFTWGCTGKPEIGEHFTPVAMGNDAKPDCLLCKECARTKTRADVKAIAKAKRLSGETSSQYSRRKEGKTKPIPARPFQGWRGFAGNLIRKERNR